MRGQGQKRHDYLTLPFFFKSVPEENPTAALPTLKYLGIPLLSHLVSKLVSVFFGGGVKPRGTPEYPSQRGWDLLLSGSGLY